MMEFRPTAHTLMGLALAALALGVAPKARGVTLPAGFVDDVIPFTFDEPTKISFLPDGRLLVAEKGGIVYGVKDSARSPMWVREDEVLNTDDRGLLGIAVDPHFEINRYLYFLYTCDPDSDGIELDNYNDAFGRLTRYQVRADDPTVVDYSSRTVLLGTAWNDGWPSGSGTHHVDDLVFAPDGSLFLSAGDGAHFEVMDPGGLDPGLFAPGRFDSSEDLGAFRSQSLTTHAGKILRINPASGCGYPSNPFWDGDSTSKRSRIWAYGLRNPFRIALRPGTGAIDPAAGNPGTLYIGEVGWNTWEEVDVAAAGGLNFGWPCFEGFAAQPDYQAAAPASAGCPTLGTSVNPALPSAPIVSLHHSDGSLSIPSGPVAEIMVGGVFYSGSNYPSLYRGRYFFGDAGMGWIKALRTDSGNRVLDLADFATDAGGPVSFAADPLTGDLFYASVWTGQIHHIRFTGDLNVAPDEMHSGVTLSSAWPNPSRGAVALTLDLPAPAEVVFGIYDLGGRRLWSTPATTRSAGRSTLLWPGLAGNHAPSTPGVYFAIVSVSGVTLARRFAVTK